MRIILNGSVRVSVSTSWHWWFKFKKTKISQVTVMCNQVESNQSMQISSRSALWKA